MPSLSEHEVNFNPIQCSRRFWTALTLDIPASIQHTSNGTRQAIFMAVFVDPELFIRSYPGPAKSFGSDRIRIHIHNTASWGATVSHIFNLL